MPDPIIVRQWPDEPSRTPNRPCAWIAEATVAGRTFTARSRHGATNELARQLVAAGIPDAPLEVHSAGLRGCLTWRSFHAAARYIYSEGDRPLHRKRYITPEDRGCRCTGITVYGGEAGFGHSGSPGAFPRCGARPADGFDAAADALGSYLDAVAEIKRRVEAGEQPPEPLPW